MGQVSPLGLALSLVLAPVAVPAQLPDPGERLVQGRVLAAEDGAPLGDVIIVALHDPGVHALSSPSGRFALRLPAGEVRLVGARVGFAPETLAVARGRDTVTFRMREAPVALEPIAVAADPGLAVASSRSIRELDLRLRRGETAQELLRLAPGLVIAQHAGGGKAEQIFVRGFDADHGTDVAISVDGVPVNMVSHGHGQGYADLHYLIPEVVERGEVRKGPYAAQDGNFATAGAVEFRTRDRIDQPLVEVWGGSFGTVHGVALLPFGAGRHRFGGYVAAAGHISDGPVLSDQDYRRFTGFAKLSAPLGRDVEIVASGSSLHSRWDASGQIPERAVRSGRISRFGAIDDSEGGSTSRHEASLRVRSTGAGEADWEVRAYAVKYDFELFSNFTFFLNDSVNGDGLRQGDDRWLAGLEARYGEPYGLAGIPGRITAGMGGRSDWTDVRLDRQTRRRILEHRVDSPVRERHGYVWVRQDLRLGSTLRAQLGFRGDVFHFEAHDRIRGAAGRRMEALVTPKLNLALGVSPSLTLFANAGLGFHSNDARLVVAATKRDRLLPRATGAELGARGVWPGGSLATAIWRLDLESELIYVGDVGTTEASGRTRRAGIDLEGRLRLLRWLWADADLNLAWGRSRDAPKGSDRLPLAPTLTSTAGLTVRDAGRVSGGMRYRHVGTRAANEDGSVRARGYTVVELLGRWSVSRLDLLLAVDNLFDVEWNEAQFATTSRLQDEPGPVTELHFTPGPGRDVQVGVEYRF